MAKIERATALALLMILANAIYDPSAEKTASRRVRVLSPRGCIIDHKGLVARYIGIHSRLLWGNFT